MITIFTLFILYKIGIAIKTEESRLGKPILFAIVAIACLYGAIIADIACKI